MKKSWQDLEDARTKLRGLSRAELARRAGISESAFTKGLSSGRFPQKQTRQKVELILEAVRMTQEAGL